MISYPIISVALIAGLTPVVAPMLVAVVKTFLPKLPTWLLPILAVGLGVGLQALDSFTSGGSLNPILGAVLGAAGVAVREIYDQVKKAIAGS